MKKIAIYHLLLGLSILCFLFGCSSKRIAVKTSATYDKNFQFEEDTLLKGRMNVGIAFSGGGSRSASATIGQLRALESLNLLDKVKYISCVSGGSWAATSYIYSPYQSNPSFLGKSYKPSELTLKRLKKIDKATLPYAPSHAHVFRKFFKHFFALRGDEIFSFLLHDVYFKRLGLKKRNRFMAYDEMHTRLILDRQTAHNNLDIDDFTHVHNTKKPFLIVNGTVIGGIRNSKGLGQGHIEFTPLYSGQSSYHKNSKHPIGGGYIETFGLDSRLTKNQNEKGILAKAKLKKRKSRFTPTDAMAISGSAPSTYLYRKSPKVLANLGLPEINLWSVYQFNHPKFNLKKQSLEFALGDGGNSENLGIIALLKRKVDRIIVFANSKQRLCPQPNNEILIDAAITKLFGEFNNFEDIYPHTIGIQLFSNENGELQELKDSLFRKREGKAPLVFMQKLKIHENPEYGVYVSENYNEVEILWVYNDNLEVYRDYLPLEVQKALIDGKFDTNGWGYRGRDECDTRGKFPFLSTALNNKKLKIIDYTNEQVNFLSNLSEWVILDKKEMVKAFILNNSDKD